MIKVLIVEDSPVMQQLLAYTIGNDPGLKVVGIAENGEEAIEAAKKLHPNVIAMDYYMPKLDGLQATRIIMETNPIPIVIVSGNLATEDVAFSFHMIEAGALTLVKKLPSIDDPDYKRAAQELTQTLRLMSEVKLVRRFPIAKSIPVTAMPPAETGISKDSEIKLIAIGASTGGPLVIQKILSGLPNDIPVPILIVQHISNGFTAGFVEWLNATTHFPLHVATHGVVPLPGHGYVAPDNFHMGVGPGQEIVLSKHELENGLRPSVAYLFRTVAKVFGSSAVGVLLTGMGRDGADDLKLMKENGAITMAQDKVSSVVHGMPGEAIKISAATHILSPEEIVTTILALLKKTNGYGH